MDKLKQKALSISGVTDFGYSKAKDKRFYVVYEGRRINFGSKQGSTYIDHADDDKRKAWKARHNKILLKDGRPAYTVKTSPEYYSWHLLW